MIPMEITMRSYTEQAADLRRQSAKYYRRHRKDAQDAARFYQAAAQERKAAAVLTALPQRWEWSSPADREATAVAYASLGDTYLRASLRAYDQSAEYRELARQYEAWAAEQEVRLAEIAAEHHAEAAEHLEALQVERLDEALLITGFGWREAASITNEQLQGRYATAGRFQEAEERRSYRPVYPAPAPTGDELAEAHHDQLVAQLGGGGSCAYCGTEVCVAEDARVLAVSEPTDAETADFCPAPESGTHHSQPVDAEAFPVSASWNRLVDEIAELARIYANGDCARLDEFEAAVQTCLGEGS